MHFLSEYCIQISPVAGKNVKGINFNYGKKLKNCVPQESFGKQIFACLCLSNRRAYMVDRDKKKSRT